MLAVYSGLLRSLSVSSMRSRKEPPQWRANSQLNTAVRAVPMCRVPVGLGARRTRIARLGLASAATAGSPEKKRD